jgi:hypothetical protein
MIQGVENIRSIAGHGFGIDPEPRNHNPAPHSLSIFKEGYVILIEMTLASVRAHDGFHCVIRRQNIPSIVCPYMRSEQQREEPVERIT